MDFFVGKSTSKFLDFFYKFDILDPDSEQGSWSENAVHDKVVWTGNSVFLLLEIACFLPVPISYQYGTTVPVIKLFTGNTETLYTKKTFVSVIRISTSKS